MFDSKRCPTTQMFPIKCQTGFHREEIFIVTVSNLLKAVIVVHVTSQPLSSSQRKVVHQETININTLSLPYSYID